MTLKDGQTLEEELDTINLDMEGIELDELLNKAVEKYAKGGKDEKILEYDEAAGKAAAAAEGLLTKQLYEEAAEKCNESIMFSVRGLLNRHGYDADNPYDMSECVLMLVEQKRISEKYYKLISFALGAMCMVLECKDLPTKEWAAKELYMAAMRLVP